MCVCTLLYVVLASNTLYNKRMLWTILNKSWRQHPTKQQMYGHLPPIIKAMQVRRTRHAGQCWRSRDELISDIYLLTPLHGQAKAEQPARTCANTGCSTEDLPGAMEDRDGWRFRDRKICTSGATWWWWWWLSHTNNLHTVVWFQVFLANTND